MNASSFSTLKDLILISLEYAYGQEFEKQDYIFVAF